MGCGWVWCPAWGLTGVVVAGCVLVLFCLLVLAGAGGSMFAEEAGLAVPAGSTGVSFGSAGAGGWAGGAGYWGFIAPAVACMRSREKARR